MTAPPRPALGLAQVCAAGVLWGTGGLVVTLLHEREGLGAMTTSAWRMALGALALIVFAALTRQLLPAWQVWRRHPVRVTLVGCGTAAYQGLYFVSVLMVGVSVATVVSLGLAPILASVWEHLVRRTRPSAREVLVLVTALAGMGLITVTASGGHGSGGGNHPVLGLVLAVVAGATYAATTLVGRELARSAAPIALTTAATTLGALALFPFLLGAAASGEPVVFADPGSLALMLYLGVATMALAYGLLYAGLRTTSGSAATVATLVEPLSAALLAAVVLSEQLSWLALVGGVMILAAVVGLRPEPEVTAHP